MGSIPKLDEGTHLVVGSHNVTIVKYLSEGGFAHIYEVGIEPTEGERERACLKRVIVPDKNGLNQLRKEVEVMKVLRHARNIVRYYDSHAERLEDGRYQVLVLMELCPNNSLLDYMNAKIKTKLTEKEILKVMMDISIGIYEMHKKKMVHRDIKIENVLIDVHHNFKLCDFGSTSSPIMPPKDQQGFQIITHDIMYQTTPQYRAPEMIDLYRGFPIDEKADVWALGCFLYKLCYYTTPFEANGDIAILHATFQFLPAPVFSNDLKNLIVIMLQENPLFRPNIVQVIILLAKMIGAEFEKLQIEDFYRAGSYNFQALHEYQMHKQQELLKQQQLYYQQHAMSAQPESTPVVEDSNRGQNYVRDGTPAELKIADKLALEKSPNSGKLISTAENTHSGKDVPSNLNDAEVDDREDLSFSELETFGNIEERYPSLDALEDNVQLNATSVSRASSQHDLKSSKYSEVVTDKKKEDAGSHMNGRIHEYNNNTAQDDSSIPVQSPSNLKHPYPYPATNSAVSAIHSLYVGSPIQAKSQLHNYPHSNSQYVNSQPNKYYSSTQSPVQYPIHDQKSSEGQMKASAFEKIEAWEKLQSRIDKDAEKLADDIFSGQAKPKDKGDNGDHDNNLASQTNREQELHDWLTPDQAPNFTRVSPNFEASRFNANNEDGSHYLNQKLEKVPSLSLTPSMSSKSNVNLDCDAQSKSPVKITAETHAASLSVEEREFISPTEITLGQEEEIAKRFRLLAQSSLPSSGPNRGNAGVKYSAVSPQPDQKELLAPSPEVFVAPNRGNAGVKYANVSPQPSHKELLAPSPEVFVAPNKGSAGVKYANVSPQPSHKEMLPTSPEVYVARGRGHAGVKYATISPQPSQNDLYPPSPEVYVSRNRDGIKSNPWGEFTLSSRQSSVKRIGSHQGVVTQEQEEPQHLLSDKMKSLALNDKQNQDFGSRRSFNENRNEVNLIDLEVGLNSSSSSTNTPVLKPSTSNLFRVNSDASLIDLEIEDDKKHPERKHQFKKRVSSRQNPSRFSFQEEVIDFASDDENPENNSTMNRISIRNSLKKPKGRKSNEHKRTDSSTTEKRKISFFGSSSST